LTWAWKRAARLLPIKDLRRGAIIAAGLLVAVAVVCARLAVLNAAYRIDEASLERERQLFADALASRSERVLRELESVSTTESARRHIRSNFDPEWANASIGLRLQSFFHHDFVLIADGTGRIIYAWPDMRGLDADWLASIRSELKDLIESVRASAGAEGGTPGNSRPGRLARLQTFQGGAAMVAAVAVPARDQGSPAGDPGMPVVVSVKFIGDAMLRDLASILQLRNLRRIDATPPAGDDYPFDLTGTRGHVLARFAWTPAKPGTEFVHRTLPFTSVVLAGLAVLALLVATYMRHTAATIARTETRLRHLARHDPLSGLPNRILFGERLEAVIEKVRQGGTTAAVFYIDLDHFKDVNDTLGHPIGDELIRSVAQRLARTVRDEDLVSRLGGDEFAVIIPGGFDHGALQAMAARMIAAICSPYSIIGQSIVIGASVGIVIINAQVAGAPDVMRHADMALYRAKNEGRNRACIYDGAMDADLVKRKQLEHELRLAIETDALHVAYQPVVNASGETIIGVEALCRWIHPQRGEIPPSEFIPIAEHSGLILALGEQILRRACLDGKAWPELTVAVNVSALQFRRADFVEIVERVLSSSDFDPTRLELEVTESTVLGNADSVELAMFRLKALGVRLALDDFGTGYSSLLYLRRFPFDKLKIDSSFVRSIERAADAAAIVHAVVSLGRGLGMKVTAEGVETAEQHLFLRAAGVHSMQGYRFGRPSSAAEITRRLAEPKSSRVGDGTAGLAMAG
jgi:diguanylate cyclase (GGDEF)-like protein